MTEDAEASQLRASRTAGVAYLVMVLGGILWWVLVGSKLVVAGDAQAGATAVLRNEQLFRLGIVYEVLMSLNLIALAWSHHTMLAPAGRHLAAVGRYLVLTDAFLSAVMVLGAFVALQALRARSSLTALGPEQLSDVIGLYLNVRIAGHTIAAVFLHLGMIVFYYLLFTSRSIPRILAAFGLLSYALGPVAMLVNIIVPGSPMTMMTFHDPLSSICIAPSIVLELIAGPWFLAKGLTMRPGRAAAAAT